MDGSHFDGIVRGLATTLTRRRALAGLFGLAVAGAASEASAAERRRPCQRLGVQCTRDGQCCSGICRTQELPGRRRRQVCACPAGLQACRGECVEVESDASNCGACGQSCNGGECIAGECTIACRQFDAPCDDDPASCCADLICDSSSGSKCLKKVGATCQEDNDCSDLPISTGCIGGLCTVQKSQ